MTTRSGRSTPVVVITALATLLLAGATWLAVATWWRGPSSYGVLGYLGAFALGALALMSLSAVRAGAAETGARRTVLLVLASLPLAAVALLAAAGIS